MSICDNFLNLKIKKEVLEGVFIAGDHGNAKKDV